jgi:hypothetical protein
LHSNRLTVARSFGCLALVVVRGFLERNCGLEIGHSNKREAR